MQVRRSRGANGTSLPIQKDQCLPGKYTPPISKTATEQCRCSSTLDCCFRSCVTFSLMAPTAGKSCPPCSPSSAAGLLRSSPDPKMPVRSRSNRDVGSLNERLHGSTAADVSRKISRKPSRVPRRGCCSPGFVYFLGVWQGPEFMGINIESDSKGGADTYHSTNHEPRPRAD